MVRLADPGTVTLGLSKLQLAPASDEETEQVRLTEPVNPSLGVTFTATVLLPPMANDTLREVGRTKKWGLGAPARALLRAVASIEPNPVTWS